MQNRLDIVLSANLEGLRRGFREAQRESKKAASSISNSLRSAGDGAQFIERALSSVEAAFAESADAGKKALADLADKSTDAGRELRRAFEGSGKSVEEVEKEIESLVKEITNFADAQRRVAGLKGEFDALKRSAAEAEEKVEELDQAIEELEKHDISNALDFQTALQSAEVLSGKLSGVTGALNETAAEGRNLERAIKQAFSDPQEAQRFIEAARALKDEFGELIDEDNLGLAIKRLDTLGAATEKNLTRISKLALDAGKDLDDAADDLGEFLAPLDSGNADFAILGETLRSSFGIAAEALREYGAEVDSNGKLIAKTRDQQLKAQAALKRYIDENNRFADIATRSKDAQARLTDEVDKFKRGVGDQVNELKNLVAEGLIPVAKFLNDLPQGFKTAAAGAAVFLAPLAAVGVATAQAISVLNGLRKVVPALDKSMASAGGTATKFSGTIKNLLPRLRAFATGVGGLVAISAIAIVQVGRLKNAISDYADSLEDVDKAQVGLLQTQAKALRSDTQLLELRKLSIREIKNEVDALTEFADKRVLATKAIQEAAIALQEAEDGNGDVDAAKRRLAEARQLRNEVDQGQVIRKKAEEEIAKVTEAGFARAREAYKVFKDEYDRGVIDSEKKALQSLESIAGGLDPASAKEVQKELRQLRESVLDDELASLHKRLDAEEVTADQSRDILARLLSQYQANSDKRAEAEESLSDRITAQLEKRLQQQGQYAQRTLDIERQAIQQRADLAQDNPEIASLERRLAKGEDVVAQIKRQAKQQTDVLKGLIDEEAQLDRLAIKREKLANINTDPKSAATFEKQAAAQLEQVNKQVAADKAKLDRELADQSQKLDERRAKIREDNNKKEADQAVKTIGLRREVLEEELAGQQQVFDDRRRQLEQLASLGRGNARELEALAKEELKAQEEGIKRRLELAKQEIFLKEQQANVGASSEDKELNAQRASLELQRAQREARKDLQTVIDKDTEKLREQTKELKKQYDLLKQQNDERKKASGFDTSFGDVTSPADLNNFGGGFGQSRFKGGSKEDGRTLADLDRNIKRNETLIKQRQRKAASGASTSFGSTSSTGASSFKTQSFGQSRADKATEGQPSAGKIDNELDAGRRQIEELAAFRNEFKSFVELFKIATDLNEPAANTTTSNQSEPDNPLGVNPGLSSGLGVARKPDGATDDKSAPSAVPASEAVGSPPELVQLAQTVPVILSTLQSLATSVGAATRSMSSRPSKLPPVNNFADRNLTRATESTIRN